MKILRLLVLAAMCAAFVVYTLPASADCPTDNPKCHLTPPQSVEVNPNPLSADGSPVDVPGPGTLTEVNFTVPMPLPKQVEPVPLVRQAEAPPPFPTLPIPLRQDPSATGCTVQALGMALDGAGGSAPTSAALQGYLQGNGMVGPNGALLEDLAATARAFGYEGSTAFRDWTMDQLAGEVGQGRPVVASLGEDGVDRCVTVTGTSPDGEWVAYNDPSQGRKVLASDTFAGQWAAQGNSGITVGAQASPAAAGSVPAGSAAAGQALAMAGLAAAAVATTAPLVRRRTGVGGQGSVAPWDRRLRRMENEQVRGAIRWPREVGTSNATAPISYPPPIACPPPASVGPTPTPQIPALLFRSIGNFGKIFREQAKSHFLTPPIGAVATKVGQFPVAAAIAIGEVRDAARSVREWGADMAWSVSRFARGVGDAAADAARRVGRFAGQIRDAVGEGIHGAGRLAMRVGYGIRDAAESVGNAIHRGCSAGVGTVRGIRRGQWPSLKATAEGMREALGKWKEKVTSGIVDAWPAVKGRASQLAEGAAEWKDRAASGVGDAWSALKGKAGQLAEALGERKDKVASGLSLGWASVKNAVSSAVEKASDVVNGKLRPAVSILTSGQLGDEIAARGGMSWILRDAWDGITGRAKQAAASLLKPNSESFNGKVSAVGGAGAIVSLVGNVGLGITGNKSWYDVAGAGTVVTGAADLVGLRGAVANVVNLAKAGWQYAPAVSRLMKVSGALSAVAGLYTAYTETRKAMDDFQTNGRITEKGGIAIANAASGGLATIGGAMLLFPVTAPVGGVLLAASSIVSGGTWIYENRQRIGSFIGNGLAAFGGAVANARTAADIVVRQVAQRVSTTAQQVAGSVGSFFGKLLGTGSSSSPATPAPTPARSSQLSPRPTPTPSPAPVRTQVAPSYTAPALQPAARPVATAQPPRPQPTPRATAQARTPSRPSTGSRGRR